MTRLSIQSMHRLLAPHLPAVLTLVALGRQTLGRDVDWESRGLGFKPGSGINVPPASLSIPLSWLMVVDSVSSPSDEKKAKPFSNDVLETCVTVPS